MSAHLTPLQVCERLIAPLQELGPICGLNPKAAYTWQKVSEQRAPGDLPPVHGRALLDHSDRHGLGLTAEHLIRGAGEAEVAAILAARAALSQEQAA